MKPELRLGMAAIVVFAIGTLVYVVDRRPDHVYFLPEYLSFVHDSERLFGRLGDHLPTFAHVYAFILLTKVVNPASRALPVCAFWFGVDVLFEIGQSGAVAPILAELIGTRLDGIPILENSAAYFLGGSFDWYDVLSIAIGALAAWVTLSNYKESNHGIQYESGQSLA